MFDFIRRLFSTNRDPQSRLGNPLEESKKKVFSFGVFNKKSDTPKYNFRAGEDEELEAEILGDKKSKTISSWLLNKAKSIMRNSKRPNDQERADVRKNSSNKNNTIEF
jgi:hypothetical protein